MRTIDEVLVMLENRITELTNLSETVMTTDGYIRAFAQLTECVNFRRFIQSSTVATTSHEEVQSPAAEAISAPNFVSIMPNAPVQRTPF